MNMRENLFQLLIFFLLMNFTFQIIFVELAAKIFPKYKCETCFIKTESSYIYK